MAGRVIKRLLAGVLTVAVVIPGNFVPAQARKNRKKTTSFIPNHIRWSIRKEITFSEKN